MKALDLGQGDPSAGTDLALMGYVTGSLRLFLPIWSDDSPSRSPNDIAGSLQAQITATFQGASSGTAADLLRPVNGQAPGRTNLFVNGNMTLTVTNALYLNAAFTVWSQESRLERAATFSFNVLRDPN